MTADLPGRGAAAAPSFAVLPAPSRRFLILLIGVLLGLALLVYWQARPLVRAIPSEPVPGAHGIVATWLPDAANTGGLAIARIAALDEAGAFEPMPPPDAVPVLNARRLDGRWFAFRVHNHRADQWEAVLDLVWQSYDRATLYQRQSGGDWSETAAGETVPAGDPRFSVRRNAFDLLLAPGETAVLYLHVQDYTRLPTQFQFWPQQDDFLRWEQFEFTKKIAFFCLLVPLIAYGLFAYATLHQRDHLHYVWILLLNVASSFTGPGVGRLQIPWLASPWREMAGGTIGVLIIIFYCRFTRSFFDLVREDPRCDRLVARVQWGLLGCVVLLPCPLWPGTAFVTLMTINSLHQGVQLFLLWVGIRRWRAGAEQAPFFVLAMGVFLFARLQFLVKGPDIVVRYDEQILIGMLCSCVGLLVLALANAYRHRLVLVEHLTLRSGYTERLENEVTERTRVLQALSERLAATVAERDRILAIIGHDLRGPASSLQSLTHILSQDATSFTTQELAELSREIDQACLLQLELLNNLLVWGGTRAGHVRKPAPLDVREAAEAAWRPFATLAVEKNIMLVDACPAGLCVLADASLLGTVLRNLLANAVKFTRPGGRIEVGGAVLASGLVELSVRDDGVGIPPERLRLLFSGPVESTPGTNEEKGVGLGLSLCRDLVRSAGGDMRLESEPGRGTTARVTLPAAL